MPKVSDILYMRLASPDLDVQEEFLSNFGMHRVERTKKALYMRGTDPNHHIHVTELGDPAVLGWAYLAENQDNLKEFASLDGASGVEEIDEPGGGYRVRMTDPNGFEIEVVHGIEEVNPLPVRRNQVNWGEQPTRRTNEATRLQHGPAEVKRMAHAVIASTDLKGTLAWYRANIGLTCSDDIYDGEPDNLVASFNRLDRGEDFVDHHVLFAVQGDHAGLNHVAFEVADIDDVMVGHDHLKSTGKYEHAWGIGRHLLGDQVFDYWFDPYRRVHEHNTDNAVFNNTVSGNLVTFEEMQGGQWGPPPPEIFLNHAVK
ncbi:MAG: VOC family protein [Rhodospirillales bacterium]|nr:VOC family protein [Rhodospirillales bacterium]